MVVTIIVALLAILLPAIGSAVAKGEFVHCQSNMRQVMMGCLNYATDQAGMLPQPNWDSVESNSSWGGWLYDWPDRSQLQHIEKGVIWQYLGDYDVYRCLIHPEPWGGTERLSSYTMNGSICAYGGKSNRMFTVSAFRSDDIMFWETSETSNWWNDGSNRPNEFATGRHPLGGNVGAGNVSVVDGAVEWLSYEDYLFMANNSQRTRLWNEPYSPNGH